MTARDGERERGERRRDPSEPADTAVTATVIAPRWLWYRREWETFGYRKKNSPRIRKV